MCAADRKKRLASFVFFAVALVMTLCITTSCGVPKPGIEAEEEPSDVPIRLASLDNGFNPVLTEVYAGALRNAGYSVNIRKGFKAENDYVEALKTGTIDAALVHGGKLLGALDSGAAKTGTDEILTALSETIPSEILVLKPSRVDDRRVLATTAALAEKYKLHSTEKMIKICRNLVLGATPDFIAAPYGLPYLEKREKCSFKRVRKFPEAADRKIVRALQTQDIQVADLSSTDPAIEDNSFVLLENFTDNFPAQNIIPLVAAGKLGKKAQNVWNEVSSKLDGNSLVFLNREMAGNTGKTPAQAADNWLDKNGFKAKETTQG